MKKVNEKKTKQKRCHQARRLLFLFIYLFVNYSFFVIHDRVGAHVSADVPELHNDASFNYSDIFFFLAASCAGRLSETVRAH